VIAESAKAVAIEPDRYLLSMEEVFPVGANATYAVRHCR
jgi:hypothetical protein